MLRFITVVLIIFGVHSVSFAQLKLRSKIKTFLFYRPIDVTKNTQINKAIKVGYGIPYGTIGINGEFGLPRVTITGGIGYAQYINTKGRLGFGLGFKGYFVKNERKLRPRLGIYYGLNNIYEEDEKETPTYGPSLGIGFEHKLTDNIVYDIEYTFIGNKYNTYRPANSSLESIALPSIGVGIYF